jgi:hypothetical protein
MDPTTSGIVVAYHSLSRPQILLVKSSRGWGMPVGTETENSAGLLSRVKRTIFAPNTALELVMGPRKSFAGSDGAVVFELAIAQTDELRDYIDSDDWMAAKWASFEEAFYIIQPFQESPLKWCERGLKKTFEA